MRGISMYLSLKYTVDNVRSGLLLSIKGHNQPPDKGI